MFVPNFMKIERGQNLLFFFFFDMALTLLQWYTVPPKYNITLACLSTFAHSKKFHYKVGVAPV